MSENRIQNGDPATNGEVYQVTAEAYLSVLKRYRFRLIGFVLICTLGAVVYSFISSQTYQSSVVLLPPDKSEGIGFSDVISKGVGLDLKGLSENSSAEILVSILQSRTMADSILTRMPKLYTQLELSKSDPEMANERVRGLIQATADRMGIITISCSVTTPMFSDQKQQREAAITSSEIANNVVDILDKLNRLKTMSKARRTREFIGKMKDIKRAKLDSLQYELQKFQQRNRAIAIDKQIEASVLAQSTIQADIQKVEMQLDAAQVDLTQDSKTVEALQAQLSSLRAKKLEFENGKAGPYNLAVGAMPELVRQYAKLKLELEIMTQVYTYLEVQYYKEQVEENRDLPTVNVLDKAVTPNKRLYPRRTLLVILAIVISSIVGLLSAFIANRIHISKQQYITMNQSVRKSEQVS